MNIERFVAIGLVAAAVTAGVQRGVEAHKAVTSKYTYNDDVFPVVRERCARCHVADGVAPMSLTTYKDAFPWAESIRAELIAGHMPPWNAEEGFGALKQAKTLTPRELDVILTWATGGNPQGDPGKQLPVVTLKNDWTMGPPDLALPLPSTATVPADQIEVTEDFTIPIGVTEPRWVRAVDLLPGTPAIVRSAVIYLKGPAQASTRATPDRVLALWVPGHDPEPLEGGIGFRLPARAELGVRIHYKKTWLYEGQALSDRSTIGLYFAPEKAAQELLAIPVTSPAPTSSAGDGGRAPGVNDNRTLTFSRAVDEDMQALAIRPDDLPPKITVEVHAALPDGSRAPMIRLNTRADWSRRYWFAQPIALPRGSRIEVRATLENPDILSEAFGALTATKSPPVITPLRVAVNVVPARQRPTAPD
jgi:hypothetical protein